MKTGLICVCVLLQYICSSAVLVLLQQDSLLLQTLNYSNNIAPTLYVTSFVLWKAVIYASQAWTYNHVIFLLIAIIELLLIAAMSPIYLTFFTVLWSNKFVLSERLVVFLTPLSLFLVIFGTTYTAWVFAAYTVGVGTWLMYYKLPLKGYIQERS